MDLFWVKIGYDLAQFPPNLLLIEQQERGDCRNSTEAQLLEKLESNLKMF